MAEERNLGIARAREVDEEEASKEALQRRMELARDSITNTVTEIKENVAQQYETVKDALDWREHFKKAPVAWTLGAAGVGFLAGYGIAACLTQDDYDKVHYSSSTAHSLAGNPYLTQRDIPQRTGESINLATPGTNGKDKKVDGPGMLARFKETSAYERLSKEAGTLGDRLVEELSTTAQTVVLPALLNKIKTWIGVDLSDKSPEINAQGSRAASYEPHLEPAREF